MLLDFSPSSNHQTHQPIRPSSTIKVFFLSLKSFRFLLFAFPFSLRSFFFPFEEKLLTVEIITVLFINFFLFILLRKKIIIIAEAK